MGGGRTGQNDREEEQDERAFSHASPIGSAEGYPKRVLGVPPLV
jgi:hypothetical protein